MIKLTYLMSSFCSVRYFVQSDIESVTHRWLVGPIGVPVMLSLLSDWSQVFMILNRPIGWYHHVTVVLSLHSHWSSAFMTLKFADWLSYIYLLCWACNLIGPRRPPLLVMFPGRKRKRCPKRRPRGSIHRNLQFRNSGFSSNVVTNLKKMQSQFFNLLFFLRVLL